jgi:8-hydroxy-5-deazaflavin:NADPH oxidoreductase
MKIGLIGGGNVASRLAALMAQAGHDAVVGMRDKSRWPKADAAQAVSVAEAVAHGDIIVLAIPYSACAAALPKHAAALAGKIIIDATNPLNENWSPLLLGQENSAGEEIVRLLPKSKVVKAFNTVFADIMKPDRIDRGALKATALICGDDDAANTEVANLAASIGFAPVVTGPMKNARYLEGMAHLNIAIAVGQGGGTDAAFLYDQRSAA